MRKIITIPKQKQTFRMIYAGVFAGIIMIAIMVNSYFVTFFLMFMQMKYFPDMPFVSKYHEEVFAILWLLILYVNRRLVDKTIRKLMLVANGKDDPHKINSQGQHQNR